MPARGSCWIRGRGTGWRLRLMADDDNPHYAHPMFWAPFVVVGEGGAPERS